MDLVLENYKEWCSKIFDKESINKAKTLKLNDPTEFQDSFCKNNQMPYQYYPIHHGIFLKIII